LKSLWTLLLLICALSLVAGLTACGGDDDADTGGDATATETPADGDDSGDGEETPTTDGDDGGDGGDGDDGDDGDDGASAELEDYFAAMEEIGTRTDAELEAIQAELESATFDTDQEEIDAVRDAFQRTGEILETAVLDVSDLTPPTEAEDEHQEFISTLVDFLAILSEFLADTEDVTTSDELDAVAEQYNPDLTASDDEFDEACFDLQGIADDNGIAADIQCGDD
jgi:hypothetical protein